MDAAMSSGNMKKSRLTKVPNKPKGYIFGAKWAGYPCEARPVIVTIGSVPKGWWCEGMEGQNIKAVEFILDGRTFYVRNAQNWCLNLVLKGNAPRPGIQYVPAFTVKDDPDAEQFYKAGE